MIADAIQLTQISASGPKLYYLHTDHLDTPRAVTDETNKVVWRNLPLNEPFGNNPPEEDPDGDGVPFTMNLRFPGQYYDKETNTHYNYYRDYDPQTGRYVQSDPIGLRGGINTYAYVGGNPISRVDPLGLFEVLWSPKDFTESRNPPAWVRTLRQRGHQLEERIKQLCPEDRAYAQRFFDRWKVGHGGRGNPTTDFNTQTTYFRHAFFESSDQYSPFIHEFRHLMPENNQLFPGAAAYVGAHMRGAGSSLEIEKDAEAFVDKLINGCKCGDLR